jgi:signal transduction histidine kinase
MCSVALPNLIYYAYIPSVLLALFFGVFIYLQNRSGVLNKTLLAISFVFAFYANIDYLTWFSWDERTFIFFQQLLLSLIIILPLLIVFAYNLVETKISKIKHCIIWLPVLPPLIMGFSKFKYLLFSLARDGSNCLINEEIFYPYIYLIGVLYLAWFIFILIKYYKNKKTGEANKIKPVLLGAAFLVAWSVFFAKWGLYNENVLLFIPFGMVIFIGFLAYSISKYHLMNIKLLATQALVVTSIILVGSELFFAENPTNQILILVTLLISIGLGYMLVKSVKLEHQRREELQSMSDKLADANDQLRKLDNSKSEFISIASHQLRTPLTAIKGFVSLLLEGSYGKVEAKQQDVLNKVYTANERLVQLVEDLLNISRMESGRMEFKFAPWDISSICQEVMDTFMPRAKDDNKYLEYKKPETPLPEIMIDGVKVREVLSNMVDNALKYTPKGGVTLKVEQADASRYTPNKNGDVEDKPIVGPVIRVTVSDTGIGIPATELPYLFAKFSRGKDVSRLNVGGTGLGLYVGRSMIENNGGKIWAESDGQGQGSRFIIEIPMRQSAELMERWG